MLIFIAFSDLFCAFSQVLIKIKSFGFQFCNTNGTFFPYINSLDEKESIYFGVGSI